MNFILIINIINEIKLGQNIEKFKAILNVFYQIDKFMIDKQKKGIATESSGTAMIKPNQNFNIF